MEESELDASVKNETNSRLVSAFNSSALEIRCASGQMIGACTLSYAKSLACSLWICRVPSFLRQENKPKAGEDEMNIVLIAV